MSHLVKNLGVTNKLLMASNSQQNDIPEKYTVYTRSKEIDYNPPEYHPPSDDEYSENSNASNDSGSDATESIGKQKVSIF